MQCELASLTAEELREPASRRASEPRFHAAGTVSMNDRAPARLNRDGTIQGLRTGEKLPFTVTWECLTVEKGGKTSGVVAGSREGAW